MVFGSSIVILIVSKQNQNITNISSFLEKPIHKQIHQDGKWSSYSHADYAYHVVNESYMLTYLG